jgi:hypothetical protein
MTEKAKFLWRITQAGNMVLDGDDFFISYQPASSGKILGMAFFDSDFQQGETALCLLSGDGTSYFILNGDFRKEYEAAFPDLQACMVVYAENRKMHRSSWSEDILEELDSLSDEEAQEWFRNWWELRKEGPRRIH